MKVALVHDYLKEYGGAERVLEALHELYPDSTVFTSVYLPEYLGPHRERFKDWKIQTSWLQFLPFKAKLISPLRLLSPLVFRSFDFSTFDVIIVSATGGYFPNMISKKKAVQICYCHTPPRYLYGYATAREWKKRPYINAIAMLANHVLRMVDFTASKNVDQYISNSREVAGRIQKFYRRDAVVINPPVDLQSANAEYRNLKEKDTKYFLTGGRLARPKHVDLIVQTCREMSIPLKVFGKAFAGYGEELETLGGPTVEFLGEVSDKEKAKLMVGAEAFIFAAEDEDFGITPIEAMSYGLPVIAYRSGGVKETVVEGETGIFFEELTLGSMTEAIKSYGKKKWDHEVIRTHAIKFGKERFQKEIGELVKKIVKEK